jgi:hypothetical protein
MPVFPGNPKLALHDLGAVDCGYLISLRVAVGLITNKAHNKRLTSLGALQQSLLLLLFL